MIIKLERQGGFSGICISKEIDAKDLPQWIVTRVRKIIENGNLSSLDLKATPKGAADHYFYKFTFVDGTDTKVIECNQYNIPEDLKLLISYIEKRKSK